MAIENLPVWTFEPNWSNPVTETLEWNTRILKSARGSEQRIAMRAYPWISYEFTIAVSGIERQYLDQMLITHGGGKWYLPLFHEAAVLDVAANAGSTSLVSADVPQLTWLRANAVICIMNGRSRQYELAELGAGSGTTMALLSPLASSWPADSLVFPCVVAELTDQPELTHRSSGVATAEIRFRLAQLPSRWPTVLNPALSATLMSTEFQGFPVFDMEPDWSEPPKMSYERNFTELDNKLSFPLRRDVSSRAFTTLERQWVLEGRSEHLAFAAMLQYLRGRARPVWVPTFNDDLELTADLAAGGTVLRVRLNGYHAMGGSRGDRRWILIEMVSGDRIFREVTAVGSSGNEHTVTVSGGIGGGLAVEQVKRICFVILCRLNHDGVSVEHRTDTLGVSQVRMTFRSAPDNRSALATW